METPPLLDPASLLPGTVVGAWRVVSLRNRGAYGVVYRVEKEGHPEAGPFALKLARHPLDPRFEREAELLMRVQHPHVPRLQDRGWWMGPGGMAFPFLVMEWVEGVSLYEWASRQRRTSREQLRLLAQLTRALEATHAAEAVHRDVKGDNALVREDGTAVLMDFGSGNFRGAPVLTRQQPPPGTPRYQSPELSHFLWRHLRERFPRYEARPADDVYALGVTAYRLVTGRYPPPVVDVEEAEDGTRFIHLPLVRPEKWVTLCPELAALIARMLSSDPAARGSAAELARALEHAARTAGRKADRPVVPVEELASSGGAAGAGLSRWGSVWPWGLAVVVAGVLLAVGLWKIVRPQPVRRPMEVARQAQEDSPDAGPSRLAERALSARMDMESAEKMRQGIRIDLPRKPLPDQRRPPCKQIETEINGGCWKRLADETPPCADNSFEWRNKCYAPSLTTAWPTTSDPP